MGTIWYCLIALMLAAYVLLDGFDLGAGIIHLVIARSEAERRLVLKSIGPVWGGNEVWLLAAGGTLFFAFALLYASGFSGFYLPLMIVLWLLILRGISIEFRSHIQSLVWTPLWDAVFCLSSSLLATFYGAALGNVVRGVPLDPSGYFFEPLWTDFRPGADPGILDGYTILVGLASFFALAQHGAAWMMLKTEGPVQERSGYVARRIWWGVAVLTVAVTWFAFRIQPHVRASLAAHPWGYAFPALALAGLISLGWFLARPDSRRSERKVFQASSAYLLGMLASLVFGLYPYVLPAGAHTDRSLTVDNARAGEYGLRVGLAWWLIGLALASGYFVFAYRTFAGKVKIDSGDEGY
jgi:cytochrome d ubiquinol oxidase subunit II